MPEQFTEVMVRVVELAAALGVQGINALPGCWEVGVDDHWWLAVNGHDAPTKCSRGPEVPPYHAYVELNGLPAGLVSPYGGTLCAAAVGKEEALCAALKRRTEAARAGD
jgi:hypothetical protein